MTLPDTTLSPEHVQEAAAFLLDPAASTEAKAAFLSAFNQRGETASEITAFVREFLRHAVQPPINRDALKGPMLDVVGTGGDKLNLFNVSSTAIFILAAGGVTMVKHGNRGITSKAGGADVLEALGIKIELPPERTAVAIEQLGVGFLFAPLYHPAFKAVAEARKLLAEKGQRSVFNILGPLLNPAQPDHQLIGVFSEELTQTFGEILQALGRKTSWVVYGEAGRGRGMDELSTVGANTVVKLTDEGINREYVFPEDLGFAPAEVNDLIGGDAQMNADMLEGILAGRIKGPRRDIAVLNAAAGFVITGRAADLKAGRAMAEDIIDRGAAHVKLRAWQDFL